MLLSFTSKLGSLLHPVAFMVIVPLWLLTGLLGLQARKSRQQQGNSSTTSSPLQGEDEPLMLESGGLGAGGGGMSASSASTAALLQRRRGRKLHHKLSALLLFLTASFMLEGCYNTFRRTGRLFPGPHLFGGALFLLAVSLNAALVPHLGGGGPEKERGTVRTVHAAVGAVALVLLVNQVWSGIPILRSVWTGVPW